MSAQNSDDWEVPVIFIYIFISLFVSIVIYLVYGVGEERMAKAVGSIPAYTKKKSADNA